MTCESLDRRARAIAASIQALGDPGDRAILMFPAGLEFLEGLFGCLYAGVIAIPAPPPEASRLKRTGPRLDRIAADARATIIVTTSKIRDQFERPGPPLFECESMRWVAIDQVDAASAGDWREPRLAHDSLAYLQYTSGSTSTPKGVKIGHSHLLFHLAQMQHVCGYDRDSVTVTWLPNFHDYGLVEGLLEPLYNATPCFVMSPFSFLKRPESWLRAITFHRGTHSQAPNFAYDLCVRRIPPDRRTGLDLSSWRAAGNGSEMINPKVLEAFHAAFAPYGFRRIALCPAYGLAEATLMVSFSPVDEDPLVLRLQASALEKHSVVEASGSGEPARQIVGCGRVYPEARLAIVDPESRTPCAPDEVGEIWIADPAVAQGYWECADETEQTFRATLAGTGASPFLRTGDLGFLKNGQLFVVGRLKDLVIIRGTNHHPQDIEWTVQEAHPALRGGAGAAFSVVSDGEERLVVAQEVEREHVAGLQAEVIADVVRWAVAEAHELDLYALLLLARGSLPKTASGKIRRQACRDFFLRGGPQILAGWADLTGDSSALPPWWIEKLTATGYIREPSKVPN
jgi:acyl-CoA synthetase (AMP-forming)/AMP-acid ligase II